jgi:hypothetical protein
METFSHSLRLLTLIGLGLAATPAAPAADVGVRIRFGLTDPQPTNWDSTVAVKPGRVVLISGWRFEQGDHATGTEGWSASTRPLAVTGRTNAQKAKAKTKAAQNKAKEKAKAKAKGGAAAGQLADNGAGDADRRDGGCGRQRENAAENLSSSCRKFPTADTWRNWTAPWKSNALPPPVR